MIILLFLFLGACSKFDAKNIELGIDISEDIIEEVAKHEFGVDIDVDLNGNEKK